MHRRIAPSVATGSALRSSKFALIGPLGPRTRPRRCSYLARGVEPLKTAKNKRVSPQSATTLTEYPRPQHPQNEHIFEHEERSPMPPKGYPADYKNPPPINPPAFTKRRLCAGNPEWLTAPQSGPRAEEFKTVCHHCPALEQCEAYLQAHEKAGVEIYGVIAGRTWRKRCPKATSSHRTTSTLSPADNAPNAASAYANTTADTGNNSNERTTPIPRNKPSRSPRQTRVVIGIQDGLTLRPTGRRPDEPIPQSHHHRSARKLARTQMRHIPDFSLSSRPLPSSLLTINPTHTLGHFGISEH